MGRRKSIAEDDEIVTVSYRVGASVVGVVEDAASKAGVTRSDVLRELLQRVTKTQIDDAIRAVQLSQLEFSEKQSTAVLKQKKASAEKLIAWIDAELQARASQIMSDATPT
jgi:hypothetical protein